jgi:cytochrome c-type biogenesis protein CcmF
VYRFTINPLVWWVWYGGMIVAFGGVIVMWPSGTVGGTRVAAGYAAKIGATE